MIKAIIDIILISIAGQKKKRLPTTTAEKTNIKDSISITYAEFESLALLSKKANLANIPAAIPKT